MLFIFAFILQHPFIATSFALLSGYVTGRFFNI